jgi:hypothetical protein
MRMGNGAAVVRVRKRRRESGDVGFILRLEVGIRILSSWRARAVMRSRGDVTVVSCKLLLGEQTIDCRASPSIPSLVMPVAVLLSST